VVGEYFEIRLSKATMVSVAEVNAQKCFSSVVVNASALYKPQSMLWSLTGQLSELMLPAFS
jgi:hypothetical protein